MRQLLPIILFLFPAILFSQCISGDCANGQGEYKFKNGIYVGGFSNNQLNGSGIFSTKRGYSYNGEWEEGIKTGQGIEKFKKGPTYEGGFSQNQRNGYGKGKAMFPSTKFMKDIQYTGSWEGGIPSGQGEFSYSRAVKYGRNKKEEQNELRGLFINGVYQGRITSPYPDELIWEREPFNLKMIHFQKYDLTDKERKRSKSPATISGNIIISCECLADILIFDASAILRKELSWWSPEIPVKTKSIILHTRQREFDIIEWHARDLQNRLNKAKLHCRPSSLIRAWEILSLVQQESRQVRKAYAAETAWNPKGGGIKNTIPQTKWDNKITRKLDKYKKRNEKTLSKIKNKLKNKKTIIYYVIDDNNPDWLRFLSISTSNNPVKQQQIVGRQEDKKKDTSKLETELVKKNEAKKQKPKQSFKPQFPRSKQLE